MSLKQKTISGVAWNSAGNVLRQILQIITMVVMTRFLSPDDFGVYAILMIFVTFMQLLSSMGTSQVIIHMDAPNERMLSSIFYFNIAIGAALFLALYLLAWPIAGFYNKPTLVPLVQIIATSLIIGATSLVQRTLLEKNMLFKRIVVLETFATIIASAGGIFSAVMGFGVNSLLVMTLLNAGILSIGLWVKSHWRPSSTFSWDDIKEVWHFTANLTGFSIINYFARNADDFLIAKYIGTAGIGLYSVAYRIMLYPLDNVSRVILRVLLPAFSTLKHDNERFRAAYLRAITLIALVTFPLMAGLLASADRFVEVVFGRKWEGMAPLLMILAPIGLIQSIVTTTGSIYMVKGTTKLMFKIGAANAGVTVASFFIGLPFGLNGVAISYAVANLLMLYPNLKVSWDQIGLSLLTGIASMTPFLIGALLMAAGVYYGGLLMAHSGWNNMAILIVQIILGIFIYAGGFIVFRRKLVISMIMIFKSSST